MLLTVTRPGGPLIVEAVLGSSLSKRHGPPARRTISPAPGAFLLGGYGGGWVSPQVFAELPVSEKAARRAGANARRRRGDRAAAS